MAATCSYEPSAQKAIFYHFEMICSWQLCNVRLILIRLEYALHCLIRKTSRLAPQSHIGHIMSGADDEPELNYQWCAVSPPG